MSNFAIYLQYAYISILSPCYSYIYTFWLRKVYKTCHRLNSEKPSNQFSVYFNNKIDLNYSHLCLGFFWSSFDQNEYEVHAFFASILSGDPIPKNYRNIKISLKITTLVAVSPQSVTSTCFCSQPCHYYL